jgi:transcriptional antiterminator RfaH
MTACWYAARSKPNKEHLLCTQLDLHGIEVFYPRMQVIPINPRARRIRPYFPGYVFARVDLNQKSIAELRWLPALSEIVFFGDEPASIPDHLINAIQRHVEILNLSAEKTMDGFKKGDPLVIQEGPFTGYDAIFDTRISGSERVRVLLTLLQKKQWHVVLPASFIQAVISTNL